MYQFYNANPNAARVGDCTIRAISKVLNQSWDFTPFPKFLFPAEKTVDSAPLSVMLMNLI